ncbi:MAG: ATP-binding protein [Trueperaceae bacterium]
MGEQLEDNGTSGALKAKALSEQLQVRVQQQAVVADLGVYALAGADLQSLMDEAVRQVTQTLQMDYCKVLELLPSGDSLLLKAGVGWQEGLVGQATVGTDKDSQAGYTLRSKEPVIVDDLRTEKRFNGPSLLVEHGVVSGISVIIYGREGPYGVLGTHTRELRPFSGDDVHFIQAIANVLGEAVERKRFEEKLKTAHDQLEQRVEERTAELRTAYQELESFSYSVSHDLRAPLRGIEGFSRALEEEYGSKLDEQGIVYLDRTRAAVKRMNALIEDLLDLSRLATIRVRRKGVDLTQLALDVVDDLRARDPEHEVEVKVEDDLKVEGDEQLLRVVFENLLGNAWKFTRGCQTPRIDVGSRIEAGRRVFCVRDNGVGFEMAYGDKLFVPFQRLHTQDRFEGSGIGLATVKRIINKHSGKIWASSEPGQGASFYFTLVSPS